ncbi:MAG: primosomal protein N' [Betaproteobacteria bacterium]|nr:primosomal protein N' [Betaproteobacteria bacterium]
MKFLRVALDVPLANLFDYTLPPGLSAQAGDRVLVPFGTRRRVGVVVETAAETAIEAERLKPIARVLDDAPRLPRDWLELMRFLAGYYQRPLGETVASSLPPRLRSLRELPRATERHYRAAGSAPGAETLKSGWKRSLLDALGAGCLAEDALLAPFGARRAAARTALRALLRAGWVERALPESGTRFQPSHAPSAAQDAAIERVAQALGQFRPFLLHGVTGSGKTEVYLQLVARVLARGGQALVLVPEISLTPQLEARFRHAFPDTRLALLHSALEDGARTSAWLEAARGEAGIVLGTRLAVLTPLPRLALVVVDEEHDASFKQQEGLRYSGRDAAVYRAKLASCPAVLGTATPSLETWYNCQAGRYALLELPARASPGSVLPRVRTIDLRRESPEQGLAPSLVAAIQARLERGEQSLVFINRRGYAPVLACEACGWTAGCERCSARMVLHAADRRLRCHHCGAESAIARACPTCGNVDLTALGRGTQRVEETLAERFPQARIVRIDRDSARRRAQLAEALAGIRRGEADILVGTQLLAKGHDFPALTLVGVLNADSALVSTDYRAPERLFATLAQVAGRAGRRERPGEVLVQTRYPGHPLYAALARHDYAGFAAAQLAERRAAGFPPYVSEAALGAEAKQLARAMQFLRAAATLVAPPEEVRIYDPVPAILTRRAGLERARLLVQSPSRSALQEFLRAWSERLFAVAPRDVRWHLDVDPIEFD